jgi:hypothetical protein
LGFEIGVSKDAVFHLIAHRFVMTGNSSFCVVGVSRGSDFGHIPRFTCQIQITDAIVKTVQRHVFDHTEKRRHCRSNETDS